MTAPTTVREHGTRVKYVVERCRCEPCTESNRVYAARYRRQIAYGRTDMIDAGPAREHVQRLQAAGMGWRTVARAASISTGTVSRLLGYDPKSLRRLRRATAERLLAVQLELRPGALVDGTGTRRRLQALVAIGWTQNRLAAQLGWDAANFTVLINGSAGTGKVEHRTAEAVRELYDRLWDAEPDNPIRGEQDSRNRARRLAQRRGWLPPVAWDDDALDDPAAAPSSGAARNRRGIFDEPVDYLELELLLTQQARADQVNYATRCAAVAELTERGMSAAEIAAHIDMSQRNVVRLRGQVAS